MKELENIPEISFINNDSIDDILSRLVEDYEAELSKIEGREIHISGSSKVMAELKTIALEFSQMYQMVDRAGKQGTLKYSYGEYLDNIAAGKNTVRNPASPASVKMRFHILEARESAVSIPVGTRVSNNGDLYFETKEYFEIRPGELYVDADLTCSTNGEIGNNISLGDINVLVDPINYIYKVENITVSSGGTDIETDDSLRQRTMLAPSAYSVAGPAAAYEYWIKTFKSNIIDVKVTTDEAATVNIIVLLENGELPNDQMLEDITEFISDSNIRPLTDKVTVNAPEVVEYGIELKYYINKSDKEKAVSIQTQALSAVDEYTKWQNTVIGRDINPDELMKYLKNAGVKRVEITKPTYQVLEDNQVASLTQNVAITYGGIEND